MGGGVRAWVRRTLDGFKEKELGFKWVVLDVGLASVIAEK